MADQSMDKKLTTDELDRLLSEKIRTLSAEKKEHLLEWLKNKFQE